jgi:hypothetical protein
VIISPPRIPRSVRVSSIHKTASDLQPYFTTQLHEPLAPLYMLSTKDNTLRPLTARTSRRINLETSQCLGQQLFKITLCISKKIKVSILFYLRDVRILRFKTQCNGLLSGRNRCQSVGVKCPGSPSYRSLLDVEFRSTQPTFALENTTPKQCNR